MIPLGPRDSTVSQRITINCLVKWLFSYNKDVGRSDTRQGQVGTFYFSANHIIYTQPRSDLVYCTRDYPRFCQQTCPTRTLASRILRLLSINRACTASRGRGNARAVRAPLTSACACIARSSLRASLGYAGRRRRPPNRKEISPASTQAQTSNNCPTPSPKLPPSRGRQRVTWRRSSPRISPQSASKAD